MKLLISPSHLSDLQRLGYLKASPYRCPEGSSLIVVRGVRYWEDTEENIEKEYSSYENLLKDDTDYTLLILKKNMEEFNNFKDFLKGNLEISVNLTPLNIGRDKLIVRVNLGEETISGNVHIIETNGLGQRKIRR